jgi:hypothetical protein
VLEAPSARHGVLSLEEEPMRWFCIREAQIDPELRETFERYGTVTMQMLLATNTTTYRHKGNITTVETYLSSLLPWLTEQYDRAERKETWGLTLEVAVTIFVAIEVLLSVVSLVRGHSIHDGGLPIVWLKACQFLC